MLLFATNAVPSNRFTASNQSVQNEPFIPSVNTGYENSDLKIDGESAEEVAGVVKTNIPKFMEKFKKGKKVSWNWSGFIFGPYYLSSEKCIRKVQYSWLCSLL